jgi:acid phosphatase
VEAGTGRCKGNGPRVIIALFGDNIRDFIPMESSEIARQYRQNELSKDPNWGKKYFMLPNPTYGAWEKDYN